MIEHINREKQTIFTPSRIIDCYNNAYKIDIESYPVLVKGIYSQTNQQLYGGYYYDQLTEEGSQVSLVIKIAPIQRGQFDDHKEKLITTW